MNFKQSIKIVLFYFRRIKRREKPWIMGRIACMGKDVFEILNINIEVINVQKGRVDYLNKLIENTSARSRTSKVVPFILREDIKDLVFQQEVRYRILNKPPVALYMDSFSELTDQMFKYKKKNWYFCVNYSDVNHGNDFESEFESLGLLSTESLISEYRKYFMFFREKYAFVPIIFLHFPVKLDRREKFHLRYQKIKEAIDMLEVEFQPFYSFTADQDLVDWPENVISGFESFPYHYNKATYQDLADKIRKAGVFNRSSII